MGNLRHAPMILSHCNLTLDQRHRMTHKHTPNKNIHAHISPSTWLKSTCTIAMSGDGYTFQKSMPYILMFPRISLARRTCRVCCRKGSGRDVGMALFCFFQKFHELIWMLRFRMVLLEKACARVVSTQRNGITWKHVCIR